MGAMCIWFWLGSQGEIRPREYQTCVVTAIIFMIMSLSVIPWEMVQRLGEPFMKLVSMLESPGIFFGMACVLLTIPSAYAVGRLREQKNGFLRVCVPVMILMAAIGTGIYICNSLLYK